MEVAPFFVDFHHFLSIFTIFCRFSRFTHFCRDLHFVEIYALFPPIFFGQNSHHRHITHFSHVCPQCNQKYLAKVEPFQISKNSQIHNLLLQWWRGQLLALLTLLLLPGNGNPARGGSKSIMTKTRWFLKLCLGKRSRSKTGNFRSDLTGDGGRDHPLPGRKHFWKF